ncbi:PorT family protein [Chitinophaga pendula]|uniref:porin family protein n=1 Tax=Chitinophaga TaxID=79328 RepID=UPI000BAFE0E4|nr:MULTISPECIES: porin family protein [Chitinophaga]ASZ11667.1 hypothetical protein CK934_12200 [Chitinophaga sp. MD30]UCJ05320.1 PorT family protein [Chitinophaga pendula]
MKKLFLVMAVLGITALSTVQGQSLIRFGIKGGANLGKLQGNGYQDGFKLGYHLGGLVQVNFYKGWGVQGEVIFSQSTTRTVDNFSEIYKGENISTDANGKKIKLNYLSIPILASIPLGTPRVKLQLGPQYSILLSDKNVIQGAKQAFKSGDFSAVGGLWVQLPVVNLSARYIVGLSNVSDIAATDKWKNQGIQLGVGVTF